MTEDQKEKHAANVEEQTVLLRSVVEILTALAIDAGAIKPTKPAEPQNDSSA